MTTMGPSSPGGESRPRWAVVGGGMLGLTLALRLSQQGKRVTLFEAADHIGGLTSAWQVGDVVWDRYYHVTLLSDQHLRGLLRELGLEEGLEWRTTKTGCYAGGRHYSVSDSVEFLRFPVLGPIAKARLAATILYGSRIRDGRRLERLLVEDWLRRWSGAKAFERFWLPLLRSKLGETYRETSAAFIWTTIRRLYAARRSGLKREMFGYVPGGYARILERVAEVLPAAGVEVILGAPVASVLAGDGGLTVTGRDGSSRVFDRVVVTAATPLAAKMCPQLEDGERQRLERVRYLGIVCASVLLKRPLEGFYVTNILDDGLPFTGVIEMSALVDPDQFGGQSLLYLPRYLAADDPFLDVSDESVESQFLDGLSRMYPSLQPTDVVAFRVSRARYVLPLATLGYSDDLVPLETSIPGLYLANSAQIVNGTLNVNETVQLAERVAGQLRHPGS